MLIVVRNRGLLFKMLLIDVFGHPFSIKGVKLVSFINYQANSNWVFGSKLDLSFSIKYVLYFEYYSVDFFFKFVFSLQLTRDFNSLNIVILYFFFEMYKLMGYPLVLQKKGMRLAKKWKNHMIE